MINKVSHLDKLLFVKHLSVMIKAGLSLREGVSTIEEQAKSKSFKKILNNIVKKLDNGEALGESLSAYPNAFNELFVNLIKAGEASGSLEENLNYLSIQLEKDHDLRRKVKAALLYPLIILIATLGLGGALSIFVLPKLIPLFKSLNVDLPLYTKILLFTVESIQNYGLFILGGIILLIIFIIFISKLRPIKSLNHRILLKIPIVGTIAKNINLAVFSRTLATLIKSGVSILEAMDIASNTLGNVIYKKKLIDLTSEIQQGKRMTDYLKKESKIFPSIFSRMIAVGEETGNLENSLFYLADFYEKEVDSATKNLSTILEPILLVIIGLVVAFVAISIISPIYQITRGLRV